jgi:hypothetical protein
MRVIFSQKTARPLSRSAASYESQVACARPDFNAPAMRSIPGNSAIGSGAKRSPCSS